MHHASRACNAKTTATSAGLGNVAILHTRAQGHLSISLPFRLHDRRASQNESGRLGDHRQRRVSATTLAVDALDDRGSIAERGASPAHHVPRGRHGRGVAEQLPCDLGPGYYFGSMQNHVGKRFERKRPHAQLAAL